MLHNTNIPSNMKHIFTIDSTIKRTSKPAKGAVYGKISDNIKNRVEYTISEFADMVAPAGYTFSPVALSGPRSNKTWESQSVFCLDFDSGIAPEAVIARFSDLNIKVNVVYTSFSDSPELRKFRACMFIDQVITDVKVATFITINLMNIFRDVVDVACKDPSRYFLSGKEVLHIDTDVNNTQSVIDTLSAVQVAVDSMKTRKISEVVQKAGSSYIYKDIPGFETEFNNGKMIEKFDFNKCRESVLIFNDFLNGVWLTHPQIFGLATNLSWVQGGLKLMKDTMLKFNKLGKTEYSDNNFGTLITSRKYKYLPTRLENFSPYVEDSQHLNLINAERTLKGEVVDIKEDNNMMSLIEAEQLFKEEFDKAMNSDGGVYLFKVPTGLGKTAELESITNATLAFPTHKLKEEVAGRMQVSFTCTPELPNFTEEVKERIEFLNRIGLSSKSSAFLNEVILNTNGNYDSIDVELAKEYKQLSRESYGSKDTLLTTHERAMFSKFRHSTLIFDEDPLQTMLQIKTLKIGDLITLEAFENTKNEVKAIIDYLRHQLPSGQIIDTPMMAISYNAIVDNILDTNISSNFIDFLDSVAIIKDVNDANCIHFITKRVVPEVNKLIIMSATASEFIYRKIYPNLKVIDITNVTQVGNVIQNTNRSYSRESLKTGISSIKNEVKALPVITFAAFKNNFDNPVEEMHFGNCSGYDTLKGQDIAVVGTPHLPNFVYFLYAKALGFTLTNRDNCTSNIDIVYNDFKFKFNTFENEDLRNIQLSLIESELIQAVGRPRTLREEATVYLYSSLPLRQTTTFNNVKLSK